MSQARIQAVNDVVSRPARKADWPKTRTGANALISDIYNCNVFTLKKLQDALPKPVYNRFLQQQKVRYIIYVFPHFQGRQPLDRPTADAIAHAVKVWSMEL